MAQHASVKGFDLATTVIAIAAVASLFFSGFAYKGASDAQNTANKAFDKSASALTTTAMIATDQVSVFLKLKNYDVAIAPSGMNAAYVATIDIEDEGPGVAGELKFGVRRTGMVKLSADLSGESLRPGEDVVGVVPIPATYVSDLPAGNPKKELLVWAEATNIAQVCTEAGYDPSTGLHTGGLLNPGVARDSRSAATSRSQVGTSPFPGGPFSSSFPRPTFTIRTPSASTITPSPRVGPVPSPPTTPPLGVGQVPC